MPKSALIRDLIERLEMLRLEMVELESGAFGAKVLPDHQHGARNLLHYVGLRRHDIRELQQELASLGLSSLGRTESNVLGAVRAVLHLLTQAKAVGMGQFADEYAQDRAEGRRKLEENAHALLGAKPDGRRVRIMVTMPSEAATDDGLIRDLLAGGMNCMRINCAHDGPEAWASMISNLRHAQESTGLKCRVAMDLGGPKLRTGPIEPQQPVCKIKPERDPLGRVVKSARVWLTPDKNREKPPDAADAILPVPAAWLARLAPGMRVRFLDSRGSNRAFEVAEQVGRSWWVLSDQTAYIVPGIALIAELSTKPRKSARCRVGKFQGDPQILLLRPDDTLLLTRSLEPGFPAVRDAAGACTSPARIGVTLPQFFDCIQPDDPIWFDDGKIGGVVTAIHPDHVEVRITHARPNGEKLAAEKGINIPRTQLTAPLLNDDDRKALEFVARNADIVNVSFVRTPADVQDLYRHLDEVGGSHLGIVLKIETQQAFENLPGLLLEAMRSRAVGVMIARGDLAIECGFERLAEIQEEILWISEAAHIPVIWATQVLESLAKTGKPSRSEITDAAMGERAECVMLNKGPYIVNAVQVLDGILRRMEGHQEKKTPMLRRLNVAVSFDPASPAAVAGAGH